MNRAQQGAIKGAVVGVFVHLALWVGAIGQGQPIQISPLIFLICIAGGAALATFKKP